MAIKYKINKDMEVKKFPTSKLFLNPFFDAAHYDHIGDAADQLYKYLYPKIWELLNNQKYFRKSKEYGVLYAKEFAQHCFYIEGKIRNEYDGSLLAALYARLQKGRLAKYLRGFGQHLEDVYIHITPFIYIKRSANSRLEPSEDLTCSYGIYSMMHTMGFNRMLNDHPKYEGMYVKHWRYFYQMLWKTTGSVRKTGAVYASYYPPSEGKRGGKYVIWAGCDPSIKAGYFNIRTYRFLRNIFHIDSCVQRCGETAYEKEILAGVILAKMSTPEGGSDGI